MTLEELDRLIEESNTRAKILKKIRVKDSIEHVFWFSKSPHPKASNLNVLTPCSADMKRLIRRALKAKTRPSGHVITKKFATDRGGAIPPELLPHGPQRREQPLLQALR